MRALIVSTEDPAGMNIKQILIEEYGFSKTEGSFDGYPILKNDDGIKLVTSSRDLIHTNHIENAIPAEAYIFCSRHRAESGKPALLVHSTGNYGQDVQFGGEPKSLSIASGSLVSAALKSLEEQRAKRALSEFDVTLEATHHGPTSMNTPLAFIELGSTPEYWNHKEGARAVAETSIRVANTEFQANCHIGFGGTHYASKFNKLVLEKDMTIGHIAPKYALNDIDSLMVKKMIARTKEKVVGAIIDWKGTNKEQRDTLLPILDDLGLPWRKARSF